MSPVGTENGTSNYYPLGRLGRAALGFRSSAHVRVVPPPGGGRAILWNKKVGIRGFPLAAEVLTWDCQGLIRLGLFWVYGLGFYPGRPANLFTGFT